LKYDTHPLDKLHISTRSNPDDLADKDVAERQTTAVVVTLRHPTALGIVSGFARKEKITSNPDRLTQCGMLGAGEFE
jgi:hypothetical protein